MNILEKGVSAGSEFQTRSLAHAKLGACVREASRCRRPPKNIITKLRLP